MEEDFDIRQERMAKGEKDFENAPSVLYDSATSADSKRL